MDFLRGLREATAHGITKDEYTDIWNKEMDLKLSNNMKQNIASKGVTSVDAEKDEVCAAKNAAMPLLKQIAEKQDMVQHQQNGIQQHLKQLQTLHAREQQRLQQLFEESQKGLSEKILAIEKSVAKLELTFTECVKKTVLSESLDMQEKFSVMTETFYNHMLEEMRKTASVRKTVYNAEKNVMIDDKQSQISEKNAAKDTQDKDRNNDASSDSSVHTSIRDNNSDEKIELPLLETQTYASRPKHVGSTSENSNALKDTLHSELSVFLVNVQKLLLKPISSDDLSYHIIESIKEILQCERNLTTEQLVNVQSAISADLQARLYKVEKCFKNEISSIMSILKLNEPPTVKMNMVLEEIEEMKNFLSRELPSRIVSHPKWASMFEKRRYVNVGDAVLNESGTNTAVRNDQGESSRTDKLGRNKNGCTAGDEDMQSCSEDSDSEQAHTIMLMLSISALILLTGYDAKARKRTQRTSQPHETKDFFVYSDTSDEYIESETHETNHKPRPQGTTVLEDLTDDHMRFLFGQHKQAHFLHDINYSKLSADEVYYKLKDIAPGYNLQLKVFIGENKQLNFCIQALSTTLDDTLLWPAEFIITITLVNTHILAGSKANNWHTFTKTKRLLKPFKTTGHSNYIPFCFFRDDVLNKFVYDDTLTLEIFVKYIRREEETQE